MTRAIFANGCFWCTEAVFQRLEGVLTVKSGFTDGVVKNPAYREVVMGRTGHAESILIVYDETKIGFDVLLHVFFATHDPTTLNRQGYDVGTQYRSGIYYTNDQQKLIAENIIEQLNKDVFNNKIVTELKPASEFYEAEAEHQNFYNQNTEYRYCKLVVEPKIAKLKEKFQPYLKQ